MWIADGFQAASIRGGIRFIQPKLIEIVVAGNFIFRCQRQVILPDSRLAELQGFSSRRRRAIVPFEPAKQIRVGGIW